MLTHIGQSPASQSLQKAAERIKRDAVFLLGSLWVSDISSTHESLFKLAFIAFRIIGSLITAYSLLALGYVLITFRPTVPSTVIATFLSTFTYLLLGILVFVFSKQLARAAVKGIDRE